MVVSASASASARTTNSVRFSAPVKRPRLQLRVSCSPTSVAANDLGLWCDPIATQGYRNTGLIFLETTRTDSNEDYPPPPNYCVSRLARRKATSFPVACNPYGEPPPLWSSRLSSPPSIYLTGSSRHWLYILPFSCYQQLIQTFVPVK
jgi:hypothetical protein